MTKEAIAKSPSGRVRRTPIRERNVLSVTGKKEGYHYRIVNDTGDRVAQFKEAGYELVDASEVQIGDKRVSQPTAVGTTATASVGGGMKGVVMRIPQEWYNEDQSSKQEQLKELERSMKETAQNGTYGTLDISRR